MEDVIKTYRLKTKKSAKLFEKSKKYHVDGVCLLYTSPSPRDRG